MPNHNNYFDWSRRLRGALDLKRSPVAISFSDTLPDGIDASPDRVPAGCRFWEEGTAKGFATTSADHSLCAIGVYTHNLETSPAQQTDLMDALKIFGDLSYVRQQDLELIPVLRAQSRYVLYAPLAEAAFKPDVVLVFVDAKQTLVLTEATQQVEDRVPPAMGRPACAVIPQVINTGRAALSLGCCGARAYLDLLDDSTTIFAMPGDKLEAYILRIEALGKANAVLSQFHQLRRREVLDGRSPTVQESLAAMAG